MAAEWRSWKGLLQTVRTQEVQPREAHLMLKYRAQSSRPGAAPGVGARVLCVCYRVGNVPGRADWGSTVLLCLVRDWHVGYSWFNRCHFELPIRELNTGKVMEIALWEGKKFRLFWGGVVGCVCVCDWSTTLWILISKNEPGTFQKSHCNSKESWREPISCYPTRSLT